MRRAEVVNLGHEINPDFQIGCMMAYVSMYPFTSSPDDIMLSVDAERRRNYFLK